MENQCGWWFLLRSSSCKTIDVANSTTSVPRCSPVHDAAATQVCNTNDSNRKKCVPVEGRNPDPGQKPKRILLKFRYQDLSSATDDFKDDNILGEGGFGLVYKGCIKMGGSSGLTVAVKTLKSDARQGHREWEAEVNFLGRLHHLNIVRLIGYCMEGEERLLAYEYMVGGSLDSYLFDSNRLLSWSQRMKIALGAAKGLAFLHAGPKPVIFRDFKTSNVLLDSEYNAKLSDFGLARAGPEGEESYVKTRVLGTNGYADPEYIRTGRLTSKNDVYSFGVVMLEMLTGRRCLEEEPPRVERNLVEWAQSYLRNNEKMLYKQMDPRLKYMGFSIKGVQEVSRLALECISDDANSRPSMDDVVKRLKPLQHLNDFVALNSPMQLRRPFTHQLRRLNTI